jgi:hypothetical protein
MGVTGNYLRIRRYGDWKGEREIREGGNHEPRGFQLRRILRLWRALRRLRRIERHE